MSSLFQFKQFSVNQDKCAMKVGTDGVLLGAWVAPAQSPVEILDVGTGTGVVALMLAQRYANSEIEAIEIDQDAYEQAVENFENAPWADRMFSYHASFQEFFQEIDDKLYDLILSNPPFFSPTQKSEDASRNMARFEDALPFEHLFYGASKLLSDHGTFALIIPFDKEASAIETAKQMHLHPERITRVKGSPSSVVKRSLIQFVFTQADPDISELVIENSRHNYTQSYSELVKDFYLKM